MAEPRKTRTVPATEFKQRCLALLDQVAETRVPVTVTKHGRPVAVVAPVASDPAGMMGSVTLVAEAPEEYFSTGERWEAETQ